MSEILQTKAVKTPAFKAPVYSCGYGSLTEDFLFLFSSLPRSISLFLFSKGYHQQQQQLREGHAANAKHTPLALHTQDRSIWMHTEARDVLGSVWERWKWSTRALLPHFLSQLQFFFVSFNPGTTLGSHLLCSSKASLQPSLRPASFQLNKLHPSCQCRLFWLFFYTIPSKSF